MDHSKQSTQICNFFIIHFLILFKQQAMNKKKKNTFLTNIKIEKIFSKSL